MGERRYKYGEITQLVSGFRVPVSRVEDFKEQVYKILDQWIVEIAHPKKVIKKNGVAQSEVNEIEVVDDEVIDYKYIDGLPLGCVMINIIGHNIHKHYSEEIYYCKLPHNKTFKVVEFENIKDVKAFIRKELIK